MTKNEIINNIKGLSFAYDGCHKIYIIEDEKDLEEAEKNEYWIIPLEELHSYYDDYSCSLKFISNWKLTKQFIKQFE